MTTVSDWLTRNGLEQHAEAFEREGVTLEMLSTLRDDDLKQLGLTTIAARKAFRDATAVLPASGPRDVRGGAASTWAPRIVAVLLLPLGAYALYLAQQKGGIVWRTGNAGSFIDDEHHASALLALLGALATSLGLFGAAPTLTRRLLHSLRHRTWTTEPQMSLGRTLSLLTALSVVCGVTDYGALAIKRTVNQREHDERRARQAKMERGTLDEDGSVTTTVRDALARTSSPTRSTAPSPGAPPTEGDTAAREQAATDLLTEAQEARKRMDFATAKAKLTELTATYASTRAGKAAVRISAEVNVVGTYAAPIAAETWFTGEQASYADAPTTIMVFWESWCPHCKREVPKLPGLASKWKGKGVQVVALTKITKTATEASVMEFIRTNNLQGLPVGKERDGQMSAAFAVTGIPAAAVVQGGKVVWRGHPAQLTDEVLGELTGS